MSCQISVGGEEKVDRRAISRSCSWELYTPNVHKMFCETKDESEFYRAIEVIAGSRYIVEHYDFDRVQ